MAKRDTRPGEVRCPRCGARLPVGPHPLDGACRADVYCAPCGRCVAASRTADGAWTLNFIEEADDPVTASP